MKTLLLAVLVSLVAVGCGSKSSAGECSAAIDKSVTATMDSGKKRMEAQGAPPEMVAKIAEASVKLKEVISHRCAEDKWPKDVLDCYASASSQHDMHQCNEKLPKEQRDKLVAELMPVMSSIMGGMRPGGMGGMHTMGSAAPDGSAAAPAAGSAAPAAPAGSAK